MSRHSTTEKVAELIKRGLADEDVDMVNLGNTKPSSLDKYDTIIIGGSIHMGIIQKKISRFCSSNLSLLLSKNIGLFMCYMETEKGNEEFEQNFPERLRSHARANGLLGGEFLLEKMNFFEKMIVKKIANINKSISKLKMEKINEFIVDMNEAQSKSSA